MAHKPDDIADHDAGAAAAAGTAPVRRSRTRRTLRAIGWSLASLLVLVLALVATGWWWAGTDSSLATALARAARYLPAGQTLESREVTGSLRRGGAIGYLRWESPTMAVEVQGARIGWALRPLLRKRVQLGEVHAARIVIEPRGPKDEEKKPLEPLAPIVLPVEIDLPFSADEVLWKGPPEVRAQALTGRYVYEAQQHRLKLDGVDLADGHYSGTVQLQGAAPMALQLALEGRVQAPLNDERRIALDARATASGTLAGSDARIAIDAALRPQTQPDADHPVDAQLNAHIAPWAPQPVVDALLKMRNLDVAWLLPDAPRTRLSGEVAVDPDPATGTAAWKARADVTNAEPGPWDEGRLPVEAVQAQIGYDGTVWRVAEATVRAGQGRIEAEGEWAPAPRPWQIEATVRGVRPGLLHTELAGAPVSGRAKAAQKDDAIAFDLALQAEGGAQAKALEDFKLERAAAQGQWAKQVLDLRTLRIEAERASVQGQLQLRVAEQAGSGDLRATLPGGSAQVKGRIAPTQGAGEVQARIDDAAALQAWVERLPGLEKAFAGASARGGARLDASWQGGWRAIQQRLQTVNTPAADRAAEPSLKARLEAPRLDLRLPATKAGEPAPAEIQLRGLQATLDGSLARAALTLRGEAQQGTRKLTLDTRASGGLERANQWRLALASLRTQLQDTTRSDAPWTVELAREFSSIVRVGNGQLDVESTAGGATLRGPVPGTVLIDWEPVRLRQTTTATGTALRLQSKGRMQGLPMAWSRAFGGDTSLSELGVSGDLVFDGDWDIEAGDRLRAQARIARASGDLRVQAGEAALVRRIESRGTGTKSEITTDSSDNAPSTPAGLRQAELRLDAEGDAVRARLAWDSERAGQIQAEAGTRLVQRDGGWQWAEDAPLNGSVRARLPQLGVWSMLAPPGWRIAGTLSADATLAGTRNDPRWNGTLAADELALKAMVEGLDLRDGRLRARLAGNRLVLDEFTLKGGPGSKVRIPGRAGNLSTSASEASADGGTLSFKGELGWGPANPASGGSGLSMDMRGEVRRLRALVRSDRQVTVSGDLQAGLSAGQLRVRGKVTTDRAVIILPDETAPSLGSDVVVHSAAKEREARAAAEKQAKERAAQDEAAAGRVNQPLLAKAPDIEITFDLGKDFAVQGRGITTRLEGQLDVRTTQLSSPPRITGEVKTVQGQYRAYGQELDVESGLARFNGPFDNPSLDILAIRPNISQRAGVQITGTAQSPRVRLYSDPPLPDAQALAWVVLGRASAASGGEAILMQQAALALLGGLGKGGSGGSLASRFGLDEIGFKGPGTGGELKESSVTLGKRLSKDFYVTYERSLAGTLGTLYIFYDLTRRLTLRGQAGRTSGVDLIYTVQYD